MPSNQTPNYALNQWERDDRVLMEDFNADNAKIDAALGEHGKNIADLLQVAALAPKHGNCNIETFSFVGAGLTEAGKTIRFSRKPLFFLACGSPFSGVLFGFGAGSTAYYLGYRSGGGNYTVYYLQSGVSWSGNQITINDRDISLAMDRQDQVYQVVAFCAMDR